jgi:hypothetical protein
MKHIIKITFFTLYILILPVVVSANTTGYAWSESVGYFDFSNTVVTNSNLTGYAYNDNTGWLVLDGVLNNNGTLSGYAWSESLGYFDFSNVYIEDNQLQGYAYNDNTGWLNFTDTTVSTTWAPATPQPTRRSVSSGSIPQKPTIEPTREQLEVTLRSLLIQLLTILQAQLAQLQANQ